MSIRLSPVLLLALCAACSSDPVSSEVDSGLEDAAGGSGDAGADATDGSSDPADASGEPADAGADSGDAATDTADAAPDAAADTANDTTTDGAPDTAADTTPDAPVDTTPDAPVGEVDPTTDGPYTVRQVDVTVDMSEGDTASAQLYVPQGLADGQRAPAVLFFHGFQLSGPPYASYAQRLASHGFIVLLPSIGDSLLSARTHVTLGNDAIAMLDWVLAQDTTGGSPISGIVDIDHIGVGGHSRGGKQAVLAAIEDDRFDAIFTLDAVDAGPPFGSNPTDFPSLTPERVDELTIPSAWVGAGRGAEVSIPFSPACAPEDDNYAAYFAGAPSPSFEYLLNQAGHLDFLDSCSGVACFGCPSGDNAEFTRDVSRAAMTAFFAVYLLDDSRYRPWVDGAAVDAWDASGGLLDFTSR